MKKVEVVLILFTIVGFGALAYFFQAQQNLRPTPKVVVSKPSDIMHVVTKNPDDQVGRTVIFNTPTHHPQENTGLFYFKDKRTVANAIGVFAGWEDIAKSDDKYILINDPNTGALMTKFHVAYTPSPFIHDKDDVAQMTMLTVFDLSAVSEDISTYGPALENIDTVNRISSVDLNKILQKGDTIFVDTYYDGTATAKDPEGIPIASYIIVRRYGGKQQLAQEIGKTRI